MVVSEPQIAANKERRLPSRPNNQIGRSSATPLLSQKAMTGTDSCGRGLDLRSARALATTSRPQHRRPTFLKLSASAIPLRKQRPLAETVFLGADRALQLAEAVRRPFVGLLLPSSIS